MKLSVDLSAIERVRESIGAPPANVKLIKEALKPRTRVERELVDGGSVVITDTETSEIKGKAGLLAIGDTQITLHIYLPHVSEESLETSPAPDPKFHFSDNCSTLHKMMKSGRYNRYVASHGSDGEFRVKAKDFDTGKWGDDELIADLQPCKNCLTALNYRGYADLKGSERIGVFERFSLDQFFSECESIFRCMPLYTPDTFPGPNYTSDFASVSLAVRGSRNWVCECCGGDFSFHRSVLHTHHLDGNRGNNRPTNLQALCIACHANQPLHGHMRLTREDHRRVESARNASGKPPICSGCGS